MKLLLGATMAALLATTLATTWPPRGGENWQT